MDFTDFTLVFEANRQHPAQSLKQSHILQCVLSSREIPTLNLESKLDTKVLSHSMQGWL